MTRILLVEDDSRIASFIKRGLDAEGYSVDLTMDGDHALSLARNNAYSLIILDRMLPGHDGRKICSLLRAERSDILILMLTAMDSLQDKIEGLKCGADDYMTKPFAFDELLARMQALLRRAFTHVIEPSLKVADLSLDPRTKRTFRGDREIRLTAREFSLLSYLMENTGAVISRHRLLTNVWDIDFDTGTKVVDVYIRYLRRKIDADGEPPLIRTVRGFGYTLSAPE